MQYLFFDLDGTISDSSRGITTCIAEALEQLGVSVPDKRILLKYIGPPLTTSFSDYFEGDKIQEAITLYRNRYSVTGWKENDMYPGIPEALRTLKNAGKTIVMATSKPEHFAKMIAEYFGIAEYFDYICGASMDGRINTKEEVVRYAMETAGAMDPEDILMIGDRRYDVEGAARLGIRTLGVLYGFGDRAEMEKAGAYRIAETVDEMQRIALEV